MKKFGSEAVVAGNIIVRQRGTKFYPGSNVGMGKDHTLFALEDGVVRFHTGKQARKYVSVDAMGGSCRIIGRSDRDRPAGRSQSATSRQT